VVAAGVRARRNLKQTVASSNKRKPASSRRVLPFLENAGRLAGPHQRRVPTSTFVPFTSNVEIIAIGHRTLPKINWTHAAHFATALWLIETGAGSTVPAVIRAYNDSIGVANTDNSGYHETITQASMRAADTFRNARKHLPLFRVCNDLLVSYLGRSDWLLIYWSREVLFSIEARKVWVEPDIRPLPF
jgi:hypothetical protein